MGGFFAFGGGVSGHGRERVGRWPALTLMTQWRELNG